VAQAAADPANGTAPLTVQFSAAGSTDSDGTIVSYAWDFGDGNSSTEADPSHTYDLGGVYQANLTVTDDDGDTGSATVTVTVDTAQNDLHIQAQTVTRQNWWRFARGVDRILVTDQNNQPVAGVIVTANYSGPNQGQASGVTNADGIVTLLTNWNRNPNGSWCFEVVDVAKDGSVYNPDANAVTSQCE
jgi:PKD repeat protein